MTNKIFQVASPDNRQIPDEELNIQNLNANSLFTERHPVPRHKEGVSVVDFRIEKCLT